VTGQTNRTIKHCVARLNREQLDHLIDKNRNMPDFIHRFIRHEGKPVSPRRMHRPPCPRDSARRHTVSGTRQ